MQILIAEKIRFENIHIRSCDEEFMFEEEIQKEIDMLWESKMREAKEKGQKIRDGRNYYLPGHTQENKTLTFTFGIVPFRNISMRNFLSDALKEKTKNTHPKGVFVAGIIKTRDDYFLFPKRSGKDVTKIQTGEITTFGGVLQPDDKHVQHFTDIWDHMVHELEEELGITKNMITHGEYIGLTVSKAHNRGIIFSIEIDITHQEVSTIFEKNNDGEMAEVLCIHKNNVIDFLTKEGCNQAGEYTTNLGLYRDIMIQTNIV